MATGNSFNAEQNRGETAQEKAKREVEAELAKSGDFVNGREVGANAADIAQRKQQELTQQQQPQFTKEETKAIFADTVYKFAAKTLAETHVVSSAHTRQMNFVDKQPALTNVAERTRQQGQPEISVGGN